MRYSDFFLEINFFHMFKLKFSIFFLYYYSTILREYLSEKKF